ncbi:MAG: DUF1295 domain-containing protein, partial [Caldilineaceae bacterium]
MEEWAQVGLWGLPWLALAALFALALVMSSLGFYRVVYFISIGYAFSIVAMAIALAAVGGASLTLASWMQVALLAAWGLRLGLFLVQREWKTAYRVQAQEMHGAAAGLAMGIKVAIWVGVSLLYTALFAPALFVATATNVQSSMTIALQWLGLLIMAVGLLLEALADAQKSAAKAAAPGRFVDSGLFGWVRCPNYLGEILFWVGNF